MKTIKVLNKTYYRTSLNGIFFACFGSFWQYVQRNEDGAFAPIYKHYVSKDELLSDMNVIENIYIAL